MAKGISVVIFEGGHPESEVEEEFTTVRHAVLLDSLNRMLVVSEFSEIILVTNYDELAARAASMDRVSARKVQSNSFRFGEALRDVIINYGPERVFCLGGASLPLVTEKELREIAAVLLSRENVVYTNNPQSSDLVAFTPAEAIHSIELPSMDNTLATLLRDQAGLQLELFPHTTGLLFDLDTPTDLLVLGSSPFAGPLTGEAIKRYSLDYERLERAKEVLGGYYLEALLVGRVGSPIISHINLTLKLRLRVFSEERGMKALGREASGEVVSLLGYLIEDVGIERFFSYVEKIAHVAFIDTRVLFGHFGLKLSTEERFLSDLGQWEKIKNPWVKEFTRFSVNSRIPVILGGHSLVSGCLWVLAEEIGGLS